jgi:hypothetical protein
MGRRRRPAASSTAKLGALPENQPTRPPRGLLWDRAGFCAAASASCAASRACFQPLRGTWFQVRRPDEPVCLFFSKSPYLGQALETSPQSLESLPQISRPGGKVALFFPKSRDSGGSSRDLVSSTETLSQISRPGGTVALFFPKSRELGGSSRDLVSSTETLPQISRPGEKVGLFFSKSRELGGSSRDLVSSTETLPQISRPGGKVGLFFSKSRELGGSSQDLVSSTANLPRRSGPRDPAGALPWAGRRFAAVGLRKYLAALQAAGVGCLLLPRASAFGRSPGLVSPGPLGRRFPSRWTGYGAVPHAAPPPPGPLSRSA